MDMTRRHFLTGGAALGGLAVASRLPAFADAPELFQERGRYERLSLGYVRIKAGAEKPFTVLHISDTHLTAAYPHEDAKKHELIKVRAKTFGGRQEEALRDSLAWARQHVDYVLHTGDMIDFQSEANFDLVRKYYGDGGDTMFGSLGNHEYSRNMWFDKATYNEEYKDGTRGLVAAAFPFDTLLASTIVNGVNFVSMDNVYGTVTLRQAERFAEEVAKDLPIVLCVHRPFMTAHIEQANSRFWRSKNLKEIKDTSGWKESYKDSVTSDFVSYLKSQPLLKGILAGHLHFDVQDRFSPSAMEYVVGGNFLFHGQEVTIS